MPPRGYLSKRIDKYTKKKREVMRRGKNGYYVDGGALADRKL